MIPRLLLRTRALPSFRFSPIAPPRSLGHPRFAPRRTAAGGPAAPSAGGANDYQLGPSNDVQPQPNSQRFGPEEEDEGRGRGRKSGGRATATGWKMFESAMTTTASLAMLALAGYTYHRYYKHLVLNKIDNAFNRGDPALALATASSYEGVVMEHQAKLDHVVAGNEDGHYYLLIGEKGTGKTSMLLSAMEKVDGEACSVLEAHPDPEIFRVRLGKALDFEFHEDYIGSLFSIRGPRETTALLDIERALNKLEKVALRRRRMSGKPLILIINATHMIRDDQEGRDLIELLQQRAEGWAATGLVTMIFNSDDYWVYERMKEYGSRMELISIRDLSRERALHALRNLRITYFKQTPSDEILDEVYKQIGGRLAFLNRVAKSPDMLAKCEEINAIEKTWLLGQCGLLGPDMDDDVMDQQKFASSAMLLVQRLVAMEREELEQEAAARAEQREYEAAEQRERVKTDDETAPTEEAPEHPREHKLPELPLHIARKVMTRADFIQAYDHSNIFTIDSHARVRADSVPMMNAFRDIANDPEFDDFLEDTLERIGDIESLGRTREVTLKDLWNGGNYEWEKTDHKGRTTEKRTLAVKRGRKGVHGDGDVKLPPEESEDDEEEK